MVLVVAKVSLECCIIEPDATSLPLAKFVKFSLTLADSILVLGEKLWSAIVLSYLSNLLYHNLS